MPTLSELADQYGAATDRAQRMANQGLISPEEYGTILQKLRGLLDAHTTFDIPQPLRPKAGEQTVQAPMPRPDPRGSTFFNRLPPQILGAQESDPQLSGRNFAIDPAANEMQRGYLPAPGRTLPDNPNSIFYGKPEQGT